MTNEEIKIQIALINITKYKTKTGKMKKYLIKCLFCGSLSKSIKPLSDLGIITLNENQYIYQRCAACQDKEITKHEIDTTIQETVL